MMGNICTSEHDESNPVYESPKRTFESYTREQCSHLYDENGDFIQPLAETKIPFQNKDTYKKVEDIMKKLEDEGTIVAKETLIDNTSTPSEAAEKLIEFMNDGAKRFEKEAGRTITYSEMRAMWG